MIINRFQHRREVDVELRHVLEAHRVVIDLHLLPLGIGHNLPADINAVGFVEYVDTHVISQICVSHLLHWRQSNFYYVLALPPGYLHKNYGTPGTLLINSSTSIWQ